MEWQGETAVLLLDVVNRKKSLTFHYSTYGNNGLYAWVVSTSNCNFWDGPYFNQTVMGQRSGEMPASLFQLIAVHEMGHTLGLAHSSVTASAMYTYVDTSYSLGVRGPRSDDVAGINSLYGAK